MRRRPQRPSSALALVCRSGPQCTMTVREGRTTGKLPSLKSRRNSSLLFQFAYGDNYRGGWKALKGAREGRRPAWRHGWFQHHKPAGPA
jgi:hypothetical protein